MFYPLPDPPRRGEGVGTPPPKGEGASGRWTESLLDLGAGAGVLQLLQDALGLFAVDTLLDRLWRLVDQVLGFFQAKPRDLADDLDHADLGIAGRGENDLELGLRGFRRWSSRATPASRGLRDGDRGCRGH